MLSLGGYRPGVTMRRLLLATGPLLLAAVGATAWASWSFPAVALTNCSTSTQALDAAEQDLLRAINEFRAANGVPALKPSPNLSRAAAWMAEDMAAKGYFDHTDSLGRSPFQRVRDCGYASTGAGENLAIAGSAQQAFNLFVNSPYGHRENMLRSMWVVAGIGRAGSLWAVTFGNVDDSGEGWDSQPPPPSPTTVSPTPSPTPPPASPTATPSAPVATHSPAPTSTPTASGSASPNRSLMPRAVVPNVVVER
ncbi:CAP domain-containing protein [Tepidiforma sp.]|uniref:CAP domain-containing protein n=1 Tax=Tepidiforma sp. TaxID=2682230 RepID=UPI002ADDA0AC|nr:CAP domain-containing protein [Tepidiforma sp.]